MKKSEPTKICSSSDKEWMFFRFTGKFIILAIHRNALKMFFVLVSFSGFQ